MKYEILINLKFVQLKHRKFNLIDILTWSTQFKKKTVYNNNYKGLWEYIEKTREMVRDFESRVQKSKDNVDKVIEIMKTWVSPLFERDNKKVDCYFF